MAQLMLGEYILNRCDRCGHVWQPHKDARGLPRQCRKCHSTFWNGRLPKKRDSSTCHYAPQRITLAKLTNAIETFNGHTPTLQELGNLFGVSRERIRQRCVKLGIKRTHAYTANAPKCRQCGDVLLYYRKKSGICQGCQPKLHVVEMVHLTCGQCGKPFDLPRREYNSRIRPRAGVRSEPRTTPLFCTRHCFGVWFGTRYGGNGHRKDHSDRRYS